MKTTTRVVATALILVMGTSGAALAHGKGMGKGMRGGPMVSFEDLDTDGNGAVTQAELDALAATRFAEVDADGNGFVTAEELAAKAEARDADRVAKHTERMVSKLDEDDDGKLSLEEMTARRSPAKMLERLDADENGEISQEEFAKMDRKGHGKKGQGKKGDKPESSDN